MNGLEDSLPLCLPLSSQFLYSLYSDFLRQIIYKRRLLKMASTRKTLWKADGIWYRVIADKSSKYAEERLAYCTSIRYLTVFLVKWTLPCSAFVFPVTENPADSDGIKHYVWKRQDEMNEGGGRYLLGAFRLSSAKRVFSHA